MENSRRPMEKAREFGLKKARLDEEPERERVLSAGDGGSFTSRFRDGGGRGRLTILEGRDRLDPVRGLYNQQQELLSQYKTAIAELTFNSKPIITNLTIIAGENTHAAKGIAATVCNNILEVPKEQKLPSLYLLDSIVKNIGGDYIKYFAVKLPEVFCKAYRQVDTSIHPSMQHLFKTWKGVFPSPPLRIIEQELNFSSSKGGSSPSVPPLRSESQSQRPGHSIHVNPKYLEARQRLEQSNKSKGIETEDCGSALGVEAERSSLPLVLDNAKQWTNIPAKLANMQPSQRAERLPDPSYGKGGRPRYVDYELASDRPSCQDMGIRRTGDQVADGIEVAEQTWFGVENEERSIAGGNRNGYGAPSHCLVDSYGNDRAPQAAQSVPHLDQAPPFAGLGQRSISRNWKNSEEEEFMWDDMDPKTVGDGGADRLKKDGWNHDLSEKAPSLEVATWASSGFAHRDSKWRRTDNLSRTEKPLEADDKFHKRELDHHLQQSHSQKDVGSSPRDKREASVDSSSVEQAFEVPVVRQTGWFPQGQLNQPHSMSRSLLSGSLKYSSVPSVDSGQLEGYNSTIVGHQSLSRKRSLAQIQSDASPSSGSTQPPSLSSEIPGLQPQRPHSPSTRALVHQHQPSQSSARQLHIQPQKPCNFSEHDDSPAVPISTVQTNSHVLSLENAPQQFQGTKEGSFISQSHTKASILPSSQLTPLLQPLLPVHGVSSLAPQIRKLPEVFQQPEQSRKSHAQPQSLAIHQTVGYTDSGLHKNSSSGLSGQISADGILAALMKGGLLPLQGNVSTDTPTNSPSFLNVSYANSKVVQSHSNVQHTLPDPPPPPAQPSASANSLSSFSSMLGPSAPGASANMLLSQPASSQPPLPPGPPPPSSVVGTLTENPSFGTVTKNPLSHLLHSLVVKGLISTSAPEPSKSSSVQVSTQVDGQSEGPGTSSSIPGSTNFVSASPPPSPPEGELSVSESTSMPSGGSSVPVKIKDQVGVDFKPDVIREIHLSVINSLLDDLQHQCTICGLRFKLENDLNRHLDWHSSRKLELEGKRLSRKWYASLREWVEGLDVSSITSHPPASENVLPTDSDEPMVLADESQCICALCGESFEDFYCHKRDKWMFKGAAYMTIPSDPSEGSAGVFSPKIVVHVNCTT